VQYAAPTRPRGRILRYLAPIGLLALLAAVAIVVATSPGRSGSHGGGGKSAHSNHHHLRAYWTVRPGDTLAHISIKTGLSVGQLEALNPQTDPNALLPGQRLKLLRHPPKPHHKRPKPLGPRFWTVRPGQSFGWIAAKTGIDLAKLEQLNRHLKPSTLQPGDRVRLRR
jgi:LysM repeat protein